MAAPSIWFGPRKPCAGGHFMNVTILVFMSLFGIGALVAAYLIRFDRKGYYLFGSGFLVFLITGIFLLASPLEYLSGSTIDQSTNPTVINDIYTPVGTSENTAIALIFILGGLWGLGTAGQAIASDDEEDALEAAP